MLIINKLYWWFLNYFQNCRSNGSIIYLNTLIPIQRNNVIALKLIWHTNVEPDMWLHMTCIVSLPPSPIYVTFDPTLFDTDSKPNEPQWSISSRELHSRHSNLPQHVPWWGLSLPLLDVATLWPTYVGERERDWMTWSLWTVYVEVDHASAIASPFPSLMPRWKAMGLGVLHK